MCTQRLADAHTVHITSYLDYGARFSALATESSGHKSMLSIEGYQPLYRDAITTLRRVIPPDKVFLENLSNWISNEAFNYVHCVCLSVWLTK